jgi:hypothetical protein
VYLARGGDHHHTCFRRVFDFPGHIKTVLNTRGGQIEKSGKGRQFM